MRIFRLLPFLLPICGACDGPLAQSSPERTASITDDTADISDGADTPKAPPLSDVPLTDGDPGVRLGLSLIETVKPHDDGHLTELLTYQDMLYVAGSFSGISAYRINPDNSLDVTQRRLEPMNMYRCTEMAVHEPTQSLFCGSADGSPLWIMDLSDKLKPRARSVVLELGDVVYARDLHVHGDDLYISQFTEGITKGSINADGTVSDWEQIPIEGNVRFTKTTDDGLLVALTSDRGLLVIWPSEAADGTVRWRTVLEVPLAGPALSLSVRGHYALVSQGSFGATLIKLMSPPMQLHLSPPGVAVGGDIQGDAIAVATYAGAYLYDRSNPALQWDEIDTEISLPSTRPVRSEPSDALRGFIPFGMPGVAAHGRLMDAQFVGDELVLLDWLFVGRYRVDLRGSAYAIDGMSGAYYAEGGPLHWSARNPTPNPLRVRLTNPKGLSQFFSVNPGETLSVEFSPQQVEQYFSDPVDFFLVDAYAGDSSAVSTMRRRVVTVQRDESLAPAIRPSAGMRFPVVQIADEDVEAFELPLEGKRFRAMFYTSDCAAMWDEMEDAVALWRAGSLDGGALPLLIEESALAATDWHVRWDIPVSALSHYLRDVPESVTQWNAQYGENLYADVFFHQDLPGDAFPTDYLVDNQGRVVSVERHYRGAFPLR